MKAALRNTVIGFLAGLLGAYTLLRILPAPANQDPSFGYVNLSGEPKFEASSPDRPAALPDATSDFSLAAAKAIPSVVFIKCSSEMSQGMSYWELLFGNTPQARVSSGSGVIFSSDGYIVTNNHVIESAETIEVSLDKKMYPAELIGIDPSTDLAVLKIQANNLPAIEIGSSSSVQVGEWVLAVGNPYSLSSTVTAGIVSAKGRRIGILEDKFPIESFIQTDAAINPGNSGGALVNTKGELVGINSAILSRTGSYTGYAFAIPADIVKKVFDDLVKYGVVQKAIFGGSVTEYNYETAKKYRLNTNVSEFRGVLIDRITENGPAYKAGLRAGDIITRINNQVINSQSSFEEILSYHYPGDKINITYQRDGVPHTTTLTLVNPNGSTEVFRNIITSDELGAQLRGTPRGVEVSDIKSSGWLGKLEVPEKFTIEKINNMDVRDPEYVVQFFKQYRGRASITGRTSSNDRRVLTFLLR